MKILYLSCHAILEFDELKLFEELGYDYFSIGAYINPKKPHAEIRPALKGQYHQHLADVSMVHNQDNLHQEQVEWADVIIIMHVPEWIEKNWPLFKRLGKRVIWRSIGQSTEATERRLEPFRKEGLEVIRYSPFEARIPSCIGQDAVIRFYKDPEEFKDYNGQSDEVITFAQSMRSRGTFCNYDTFAQVVDGMDAHVYGPNNEDAEKLNGGLLSYEKMKAKMRDSRVYFYTGTHPACYTLNFIEAFMTGIPIVAIGPQLGNSREFNQDTYEVPDILKNGMYGFVSDDISQLKIYVNQLLKDKALCKLVSTNARTKALELFGKDLIRKQWKTYLEK